MPRKIFDSWTRTPGFKEINNPTLIGLVHADRLLKLQSLTFSRPLINETLILEQGSEVAKTDKEHREAFEESFKRNKNKHSRKYSHSNVKPGAVTAVAATDNTEVHAGFKVDNAAKKAMAPNTLKEMRKELDQSLAKLEKEEGEDEDEIVSANTESNTISGNAPSVLLRSSILAGVAVGSSASSKLNYIINEAGIHFWAFAFSFTHALSIGYDTFSKGEDTYFFGFGTNISARSRSPGTYPNQIFTVYNSNSTSIP
jgi:hypothetical protein